MKKSVLLLVTASCLMVTFTECKPEPETPKNYYGVQPEGANASKDAYVAFASVVLGLALLIAWGIKKIKQSNKR